MRDPGVISNPLGRDAVAQSVERPSKVPDWCNTTDMGLNHGRETFFHLFFFSKRGKSSLSHPLITQRHKVVGKIIAKK